MSTTDLIKSLKYDAQGLIPAVIQDYQNNQVLMVAFMNQESLALTLKGPQTVFYSRSKQKLWHKGESSGHTQVIKEILIDCDKDCLVIKVEQNVAACHNGYRSCFYRQIKDGKLETIANPVSEDSKVSS